MAPEHRYVTHLVWTGASAGPTSSYQGYSREHRIDIEGKGPIVASSDPHFRGDPSLHNPEELLVASLSGCHMLCYLARAARAGLHVVAYEDHATGTMQLSGGGGRFTEVVLHPNVTIAEGMNRELALELHAQAHRDCFIAASVNFPVRHAATVTY
jgi:organic hydroperoxide reductase OsmC/OhrA